jgi:F-type H+-transporting ATPase subunit delta
MAADFSAAKRYAQAAFDLASESGSIATWRSDLGDIASVLTESQLADWFADRNVAVETREAAVQRILDVQPLALNLAKLLVQRSRTRDARAISDAFGRLADIHDGIVDAQVTTAVAIDAAQSARIEQQISTAVGKRIRLTTAVDPALLGGLVIRVGDQLVDGSLSGRLKTLKKQLEGAI